MSQSRTRTAPKLTTEPHALALDKERLRVLVYGDYGRGKTTFAGTFPKPLIIDTNGGLVTLALDGVQAEAWEPTGYRDLEALYFWIKSRADNYETIVIDSLDSLVYMLMGEMTDDAVEHKMAKGDNVSLRMQFIPEPGDYFGNQRQMDQFLFKLRQLGKHIVITSSVRTKAGRSAPNVSEGMERVVCDWASVIGELIIVDDAEGSPPDQAGDVPVDDCRALLTSASNRRATKTRFQSLLPYVINPTFGKLSKLIEAEFSARGGK